MNQNRWESLQVGLASVGRLLMPFFILWILGAIGLGWLVKSLFILLGLILLAPVLLILGLQWWVRRNLVQGQCPVCSYEMMGLKNAELQCPSCGEPLRVTEGQFTRLAPPGTIDVDVVDVVDVSATAVDEP